MIPLGSLARIAFSPWANRSRVRLQSGRLVRFWCTPKCDCCIHICPNKPHQEGQRTLVRFNRTKWGRCESTLRDSAQKSHLFVNRTTLVVLDLFAFACSQRKQLNAKTFFLPWFCGTLSFILLHLIQTAKSQLGWNVIPFHHPWNCRFKQSRQHWITIRMHSIVTFWYKSASEKWHFSLDCYNILFYFRPALLCFHFIWSIQKLPRFQKSILNTNQTLIMETLWLW